jgi:hypothetical protein
MTRAFNEHVKVIPHPHKMTPRNWSKKLEYSIESVLEDMFNGDIFDIDDDLEKFKNFHA